MTWASGQKLHREQYEIKQELGQGDFAITYLAEDRDRVNQAILHAMELQPDNRPETVEHWLKESYQVNLTSYLLYRQRHLLLLRSQ
ncbi:hypothetical protein [Nostoc sp.]|uniref:hypothetical protein n=1 Tax=Nostoc sp. TaxID=1180 RepID=UPI002FFB0745